MPKYYKQGASGPVAVQLEATLYSDAAAAGLSIPAYLNRKFPDADPKYGTAAQQIFTTAGLVVPEKGDPFALRSGSIADILDGKCDVDYSAAGTGNVKESGYPFGNASRLLFPAAVIARVEATLAKDRTTDTVTFNQMVGQELNITSANFEQPVITFANAGGAEEAKAQRVAQLANPPALLKLTTADRPRRLAAHAIGMEISEQAMRASTLDQVALTMARFQEVERDERVYQYINSLWNGNNDLVVGAVTPVTSNSLDSAATGGVLTHKAWLKFLARNRKYRKIQYVIGDIDTYLKVEGRTGRPGTNNYDPSLARIDPQAVPMNAGFGNDVKWFIVDAAVDGGPVPANTVYALDDRFAITKVTNTAANYSASEEFVLQRKTALRLDWSEDVFRMFGDTDLRAFDALTIS